MINLFITQCVLIMDACSEVQHNELIIINFKISDLISVDFIAAEAALDDLRTMSTRKSFIFLKEFVEI